MKILKNWEDCLHYVNRLGFSGSGTIQYRQDNLMCVVRAIEDYAGVPRNTPGDIGYPIRITFKNFVDNSIVSTGYRYPWLGSFEIRCADGVKKTLSMRDVSMDSYLANRGK